MPKVAKTIPGPPKKLPMPLAIPSPIFAPIPSALLPEKAKVSKTPFKPPRDFLSAGPKDNPPISDAALVKFAKVLFNPADNVVFNSSFLLFASSVAPSDVDNA